MERDDAPQSLISIALPLAGSFVAIGWAMWLVCRFELMSTLSGRELFVFPLVCLFIAACMHVPAVWVVRGMLDRDENVAIWPLIYGTWIPVVWVPSLVVLAMEGSAWVVVLLPVMAGLATALLRHWTTRSEDEDVVEGNLQSLFESPTAAPLGQTIFPALIASLAAVLGLVALLRRWDGVAGCLLAVACVVPVWRFPRRQGGGLGSRPRTSVAISVAALFLTTLALMPFLKDGPGHAALENLLKMERVKAASVKARAPAHRGYSGVILLLPPKPPQAILPPAPKLAPVFKNARVEPTVIKFDGAYWYFKEPDIRPEPDARVVHGDPLKARINSTNDVPLSMEAHQVVPSPIRMSCCSALRVDTVNADDRPGAIAIEVILTDAGSKAGSALSLGTVVLPSSTGAMIPLDRQPVHETLTFRFPRGTHRGQFNEITIRIKPSEERALAASQVSIEDFVLVP
jgi:hypothetical protein